MIGRAGRPLQYLADLVRGKGRAWELAQLLLDQVAQRARSGLPGPASASSEVMVFVEASRPGWTGSQPSSCLVCARLGAHRLHGGGRGLGAGQAADLVPGLDQFGDDGRSDVASLGIPGTGYRRCGD